MWNKFIVHDSRDLLSMAESLRCYIGTLDNLLAVVPSNAMFIVRDIEHKIVDARSLLDRVNAHFQLEEKELAQYRRDEAQLDGPDYPYKDGDLHD